MATPTLLWYDYETTGTDPVRDRPAQFAAIRTTLELEPLGEPVEFRCAPSLDVLPHPEACLITGILPQDMARNGMPESDFAGAVHAVLAEAGTCSAGYNSIRFDDEVNRNLFYRNFLDPYEHAWKNGNARWDIMDLARACHALRPEGIQWPRDDDGTPSFKLDRLAPANHLRQARAHDAVSDVEATLALARLLRARQPRLYAWHFALRDKQKATSLLAAALPGMQPLLHVSGRYPAIRGCLAMVAPIAVHPERAGTFIVADLAIDAQAWIGLPADELADRLFARRADLPEGFERPPLKEIHANKTPFVAPPAALSQADAARLAIDTDACERNLAAIRACVGLGERIQRVFSERVRAWPARTDPECMLYAGFPSPADKRRCESVRATPAGQLATTRFGFGDPRFDELLFRYRARNWPDRLSATESARWRQYVRGKLMRGGEATSLTLEQYYAVIEAARIRHPPGAAHAKLDQLQAWGQAVAAQFDVDEPDAIERPCGA